MTALNRTASRALAPRALAQGTLAQGAARTGLIAIGALALSGCSWLGLGHGKADAFRAYQANHGGTYGAGAYGAEPCQDCQPRLSRFNIENAIGPSFLVGGDAITGDKANFTEGVTLNDVSMNDAYDVGLRAELGASYALTPSTKVVAMGHYVNHDGGDRFEIGSQNGQTLTGELTDYTSYGVELGLRQYGGIAPFPLLKSVRPYVEGRVGATQTKDIFLRNSSIAPGADVAFYDGNIQATAAGLVGVETPFWGNTTLGVETGLRYTAGQDSEGPLVAGNPLAGINNGGEKWSVPVMLRGRYRF